MNILTEKDIKDALKLGTKQAKALMRTEGFPAIKIGREYRVEEEDFLNWIRTTKTIKLDYSKC